MAKYASGNQEKLRLGFVDNNEDDNSLRVVGRAGIGTTVFDADRAFVVRGDASIGSATTFTENLVVEGTARVTGILSVNSDLDVDGHTELDNLNVSGVSTFGSNVDINADLDVDGHTELDDVNVSSAITANNLIVTESALLKHSDSLKLQTTGIGISVSNGSELTATIAGPSNLVIDPGAVGDDTGTVRIKGDLFVDGTQTQINSTTIELADFIVGIATTATSDLLADGAGIQIGPNNTLLYEHNSGTNPSLKSSENLNVASGKVYQIDQNEILSSTTLGSSVINSSLTGIGTLEQLSVSGVSTFTNNINANGDLDVDGHTELDNLNVSGVSTFASNVDINADLDVDGHTEIDNLRVSGVSTFVGIGTFESDFFVAGNASIVGILTAQRLFSDVHGEFTGGGISGTNIVGTSLSISGISTITTTLKVGDDIVAEAGIITAITFDGNLTGNVTGNLNSTGVSTISTLKVGTGITASDGIITATSFVGSGSNLTGIVTGIEAGDGISVDQSTGIVRVTSIATPGIEVENSGSFVGTGITLVNFDSNITASSNEEGIVIVTGQLGEISGIDTLGTSHFNRLYITGFTTFTKSIDVQGNIGVGSLSVTGISTFNGGLFVQTGISTFDDNVKISSLTNNRIAIVGSGSTIEDDANLTFDGSSLTVGVNLDVDGHTELDNLNVSGVSTLTDDVSFGSTATFDDNGRLKFGDGEDLQIYHDSSTNNSYISESGSGDLVITGANIRLENGSNEYYIRTYNNGKVELYYDNSKKFETTGIGISVVNGTSDTATIAGPSNLVIDPGTVGDDTGIVRIKGDLFVDGTQTQINSTTIELADFVVGIATTATSDLLADGAGIEIGPDNTFKYNYNGGTNPSLKSSENLNVASGKVYQIDQTEVLSATTLGLSVVNSSLTGIGTLEQLSVSGVSTFTEKINANGDLDVDGHTELDNLNVSGVSTFTEKINANGDLDVDGHTELDNLNVSGVSTFTSIVGTSLSISGISTFTNIVGTSLSISGISTITTTLKVGTDIVAEAGIITATTFDGNLTGNVTGNLNSTGVSTITTLYVGSGGFGHGIDVNGHTELDDVNSSGVITAVSFKGSLATTDLTGTITNDQLAGSIANEKLSNSSVSFGGVSVALGGEDATPAFDLQDATGYPFTSLTGITTDILGDTTPQLGGDLDVNNKNINGTGDINLTGVITATSFDGNLTGNVTGNLNSTGVSTISTLKVGTDITAEAGIITATGGIDAIGIQENGVNIATGIITAINFVGLITCGVDGNVVDVTPNPVAGINSDANRNHYGITDNASSFDGTATDNVLLGHNAGYQITSGDKNVVVGSLAGANLTGGSQHVFIGYDAGGETGGTGNVGVGYEALKENSGDYNIALGWKAGSGPRTGSDKGIFIGRDTGSSLIDGDLNIGIGDNVFSGNATISGNQNICMGINGGISLQGGSRNITIGNYSGIFNVSSHENVYIGERCGQNNDGEHNAFFGAYAGFSFDNNSSRNIAIGRSSATGVTAGSDNTIIGSHAFPYSTTLNGQISIGAGTTELIRINETGLGIGTDVPDSEAASDNDNILNVGVVTARFYYGDGRHLTNLPNSGGSIAGIDTTGQSYFKDLDVSGVSTFTSIVGTSLSISGISTITTTLKVGTDIVAEAGVITATSFDGNLTGNVTGNLNSTGVSTIGTLKVGDDIVAEAGVVTATSFDGNLTGISSYASEWNITSNGSSDYKFTGPGFDGTELDPTIYLTRGRRYKFTNNMGAHPFEIRTAIDGSAYSDGITNNAVSNGTLTWDVQMDAPNILYYQCTSHASMVGTIYIGNSGSSIDVTTLRVGTGITAEAGIITATSFVKSGGTSSQFLKADGSVDSSTYLTSYTETDPVVAAIDGIVKSDGSTISAASAGTDYLAPTGDGSGLSGIVTNIQAGTNITLTGGPTGIVTINSTASGDTVTINATATDILSVSSGDISADDAGADKLVFWDDSESKLTYLTAGSGLSISETTITAESISGIEIENSETSVGTAITAINFSTNLTATASGGIATITASGGGGDGVSLLEVMLFT